MLIKIKNIVFSIFIFFSLLSFIACSEDSSTDSPPPTGQGINASDFAFSVGNKWNYNGAGYNTADVKLPKSVSTSEMRIISETNSNGLNGYKIYGTSKDWLGHTTGDGEDFISTENNGLWILERLVNGSTSPTKILPFGVNNATIRSEIFNNSSSWWWSEENITMNIEIKFEFLGSENITVTAGGFSNCKKIKVIMDVSQKSDTNGVEIFNGKTWYVESLWWLSTNNGLIKTQTSFNCVVDSIISEWVWDPITGEWTYIYESVLESDISYRDFRHFDIEDLMIPISFEYYKTRLTGLNYLGKYVTELSSKNF